MTGKEIRAEFLKYFEEHGHTVVSSSSLVPHDDPTLLFANAGMNQFKDTFLGKVKRPYSRATTCQKVVRAGGKHNDLENVGRTSRHHTFFEMLGNFSFGDYFKKEAITYAWDFLTRIAGLPKDKLFVSVYKDDDEAFALWRDMIGLEENRIHRRGEKDNFWQMGDTGPCGPCSEIHIDQGEGTGCGRPDCSPDCECDRHLELWNLVFMQYNRDEEGVLHPLPKPSIDTGMGLERVASVVQHVKSNYDTDLFIPIINYIAELAGIKYKDNEAKDVSVRVIADHARSTTFLISDGVLPSNEGRGYVLRRIMRRAMRHGNMLGITETFFYKVCLFVIEFMKDHYVELADKKAFVEKVVRSEEEAFSRTLNHGMKFIQEEIIDKNKPGTVITGDMVFKLYDTHGFPVDLLQDVLEDNSLTMDIEGFNKLMLIQQEKAQAAGLGISVKSVSDVMLSLGSTINTEFMGYTNLEAEGKVVAIFKDGASVNAAEMGEVEVVLDKTPFYAESGGQSGDSGTISFKNGQMIVNTTYRTGGMFVHKGRLLAGGIAVGDNAKANIDKDRREATAKNHTATHLLHKALQYVLGDHARQAGSSVSPSGLRFDFSHFGTITDEELLKIAGMVNAEIQNDDEVVTIEMPVDDAVKSGAMAIFGEKYGESVRVVTVGEYSKELCGGTHVTNTGKIGVFVILAESSVASGIRRIEAITGMEAWKYLYERDKTVNELSRLLKCPANEVYASVNSLQQNIKELNKEIKTMKDTENRSKALDQLKAARTVNGVTVVTMKFDGIGMEELRSVADDTIDRMKKNAVVLVAAVNEGKVSFVCKISKDLVGKYKAGALIKEVAKVAGGTGGGRDDMAQAGAKDPQKIDEALEKLHSLI